MTSTDPSTDDTLRLDSEMKGETFTERCRRLLAQRPDQAEFSLSRGGLEVLVRDSELYAERNGNEVQTLLAARELVAMTTMITSDSDALLDGRCDHWLPHSLRDIASGSLKVVGQ